MLHSEYRPTNWADFIGQPKAVSIAQTIVKAHWMKVENGQARDGLAVTISGPSGTGKSTMAGLLAMEFGASGLDLMFMDGDSPVNLIRDLDQSGGFLNTRPWGKAKAIIVDEAQNLTKAGVQAWLTRLERLPKWCLVVFTTTSEVESMFGEASGPFARRSVGIQFTNQGLAAAYARRAQEIAEREGLGGAASKAYLRLVQDCKNNFGMVLEKIQALEMQRDAEDAEAPCEAA
jgi:DNA polymerase III delta prime subunit